jgi:alpha-amylase
MPLQKIWAFVMPRRQSKSYVGDGRDILLQGFHWESHRGHVDRKGKRKSWYRIVQENAKRIKAAGFTWVWFPPPSDSLAPQGYIPRRWNVLDTSYGNRAELWTAIKALQPVKAMADVVLNHRVGVATPGVDFEDPPFPDNHAAVTRDDSSGAGRGNPDTGELCAAGRDLDHTNPDVRAAVKAYLQQLKGIGFRGWRYDLVKGFHGRFVGEFNDATEPEFSVGECFDGDRQKITNWIDTTGGKSAAFDFPTRFLLYEACVRDNYSGLRSVNVSRVIPGGLIGYWPSQTVTFLDNHDTEYQRAEEHRRDNLDICCFPDKTVAMGYAYILTHPGVPCVFWQHYFDWNNYTRERIERLIRLRKRSDIHAASSVTIREARPGLYAATTDGRIAVKLGSHTWCPGNGWQLAVDGDKFAVWTRR